jgi:hypothetical protein
VPNVVQVDQSIVSWILGVCGTLILFLISLGIKDIRERMEKVDRLCLEIEKLRTKYDRDVAELAGEIRLLDQRLEDAFKN